jgi:hypothetical protein
VCDCGFVVIPPKQLSRSLIRIGVRLPECDLPARF